MFIAKPVQIGRFICPYHSWAWNTDGSLDFVQDPDDFPAGNPCGKITLEEIPCETFAGFVWVNMDDDCVDLKSFLGPIWDDWQRYELESWKRYLARTTTLPCNWKVAQEAFMESYHVVATHPELLGYFGDVNSKYDVWGNLSRAMSPSGHPSPHTGLKNPDMSAYPDGKAFTSMKHTPSVRELDYDW